MHAQSSSLLHERVLQGMDQLRQWIDACERVRTPQGQDKQSELEQILAEIQAAHAELLSRNREATERIASLEEDLRALRQRNGPSVPASTEVQRLQTAVETSNDAVIITDGQGYVVYANPAFERVTGYSRDEVVGKDLHLLDSGWHDEGFFKSLRDKLEHSQAWRGHMICRKKDGSLYREDCIIRPLTDEGGTHSYVSIINDITENLRLEALATALDSMNNIGYVFSGLSHEIKNPINAANIALSTLRANLERLEKHTIADYLDRSLAALGRVTLLLKNMKAFNLFEEPEMAPVDLQDFLERLKRLIREDFQARGIRVTVDVDPSGRTCRADARALQQILLNLLANAADACADRPEAQVSIQVDVVEDQVRIRVSDNGVGMSEEQRCQAFRPFFTSKPHGTGLGLSVARNLARKMGGGMGIDSVLDRGTVVELRLPGGST